MLKSLYQHLNPLKKPIKTSASTTFIGGLETKVVNSIPFRPEWPKHSIPIQKTEQFSSHFKSRSVPDFSAKFQPERFGFILHVPFHS